MFLPTPLFRRRKSNVATRRACPPLPSTPGFPARPRTVSVSRVRAHLIGFGLAAVAVIAVGCSPRTDDRGASAPTATTDDGATSTVSRATSTTTTRSRATAPAATRPAASGLEGILVDAFSLKVGDCFNSYIHYQDLQPIEIYTQRACDLTHDAEVFYRVDYAVTSDTRYPGREVLRRFANKACYEAFPGYVQMSYETSKYKLSFLLPPQDRWENPSLKFRTISCFLLQPGTKLTASARNSAA